MRQIILDTETTGLSPEEGHRIIEIGCLEMIDRRLTGKHWHQYINPERAIEKGAESVHGITDAFVADKPIFSEMAQDFLDFVRGAELIIHNAPFDVGFLNFEFQRLNGFPKINDVCEVADTLLIARRKHPGQHNNLDALCKRYHVDNSNREYHGALLDAELLAQIYLLMTGGQAKLFTQYSDEVSSRKSKRKKHLKRNSAPLKVITATDQERQAHNLFMERLCRQQDFVG